MHRLQDDVQMLSKQMRNRKKGLVAEASLVRMVTFNFLVFSSYSCLIPKNSEGLPALRGKSGLITTSQKNVQSGGRDIWKNQRFAFS